MAVRTMTCLVCPRGCQLWVNEETHEVRGNFCPRGERFALDEVKNPLRVLTTTVQIASEEARVVPVRTLEGIPKSKIMEAMEQIRTLRVTAPVHVGDVLVEDFLQTGVPLIATKTVMK